MKILFFAGLILMLLICFFGCSKTTTQPIDNPIHELTKVEKEVVKSNENFGIDIFKQISSSELNKNTFISPLSISMALGMTLSGAKGETYTSIQNTLKLSGLTTEQINDSYKSLYDVLTSIDSKVNFQIANSIWYRQDLLIKEKFISTNINYFRAQISSLDFNNPAAADVINNWVNQSTNGKITEIVGKPIDPAALMFLINAIYFKGTWKYSFDKKYTAESDFYLLDNSTTKCNMMNMKAELNYYYNDELKIVELPYGNGNFSMIILLPAPGLNINDFITKINEQAWNGWLKSLVKSRVTLALPKFTFKNEYTLNDALQSMGMQTAFTGSADFSEIFENMSAHINKVKHNTFIEVNEEGTEAAAVTSIGIDVTAIGGNDEIIANRPFVFAIRESNSDCILFLGKVLNPALK